MLEEGEEGIADGQNEHGLISSRDGVIVSPDLETFGLDFSRLLLLSRFRGLKESSLVVSLTGADLVSSFRKIV